MKQKRRWFFASATDETDLINKVLNHPKLHGLVYNHGLSLCDYFY